MFGAKDSTSVAVLSSLEKSKATLPYRPNISFPFNDNQFSSSDAVPAQNEMCPSSIVSKVNQSSKKRNQSKLFYGQRKRSKIKQTFIADEDQNLDSDLFKLAEATSQNLDSDSSRDTIILDEEEIDKSSAVQSKYKSRSSSHLSNTYTFPSKFSTSTVSHPHKTGTISNSENTILKNPHSLFVNDSKPAASNLLHLQNHKLSQYQARKEPNANSRSIYAEMGLDEDLCDRAPKPVSNFGPKLPSGESQSVIKVFDSLDATSIDTVQIKKESKSPEHQGSFVSNDMHVSMTFEADPYDIDDDLPLSFLKNKSVAEESSTQMQDDKSGGYASIPIKKEPVDENEITSVSGGSFAQLTNAASYKVSSSKNESSTQATQKDSDLSQKFLQMPVKIKSEPCAERYLESPQATCRSDALTVPVLLEPVDTRIKPSKKMSKRNTSKKKGGGKKKNTLKRKIDFVEEEDFAVNPPYEDSFTDKALGSTEILNSFNSNLKISINLKTSTVSTSSGLNNLSTVDAQNLSVKEADQLTSNSIETIQKNNNDTSVHRKGKKRRKQKAQTDYVSPSAVNSLKANDFVPPPKLPHNNSVINSPEKFEEALPLTKLRKKKWIHCDETDSESFHCNNNTVPADQDTIGITPAKKLLIVDTSPKCIKSSSSVVDSTGCEENSELSQIKRFLSEDSSESSKTQASTSQNNPPKKKKGSKKKKDKNGCKSNLKEVVDAKQPIESSASLPNSQVLHSKSNNFSASPSLKLENDSFSESVSNKLNIDNSTHALKEQSAVLLKVTDNFKDKPVIKKEMNNLLSSYALTSADIQIKKEPDFEFYKDTQTNTLIEKNIESDPSAGECPLTTSNAFEKRLSITSISQNWAVNSITSEETNQSVSTSEGPGTPKKATSKLPVKKKKRRTRINNWYKKKKTKKETKMFVNQELSDSEETVSAFDSDSSALSTHVNSTSAEGKSDSSINCLSKLIFLKKNPVVFIKNLADNVETSTSLFSHGFQEKVVCSTNEDLASNATTVTELSKTVEHVQSMDLQNQCFESENVDAKAQKTKASPRKGKRRKGSGKNKKKNVRGTENKDLITTPPKINPSVTDKELNLTVFSQEQAVLEFNKKKTINKDEVPLTESLEVIPTKFCPLDMQQNSFNRASKTFAPTLSIASMQQDIASLEMLLGVESRDTSALDNTNERSLSSPSQKSVNATSTFNSSFIQVKKERDFDNNYSTRSDVGFSDAFFQTKQAISHHRLDSDVNQTANSNVLNSNNSELALLIKKEACESATRDSSHLPPKSVVDLLEKSSMVLNSSSGILPIQSKSKNSNKQLEQENKAIDEETDDEIQVIEIVKPKKSDVACVDLTDGNLTAVLDQNAKNDILKTIIRSSVSPPAKEHVDAFSIFNKPNADGRKDGSIFDNSSLDLLSHIIDEDIVSSNEKTSMNLAKVKQKYSSEYLKYSYPPSVPFLYKPRNNKVYSRMTSQTLNLSIKSVESRLKAPDNIKNQFGNKIGDTVKLEKYPVSSSEVECYHRILGTAPSQKLLLKCYKPPENTLGANNPSELCRHANSPDKPTGFQDTPSYESLNLIDIIQAMAAKSVMSNFDFQESTNVLRDDSASMDTKDSFESINYSGSSNKVNANCSYTKSIRSFSNGNEQDLMQTDNDLSNRLLDSFKKNNFEASEEKNLAATGLSFQHQDLQQPYTENLHSKTVEHTEIPANELLTNINSSEANNVALSSYHYSSYVQKPPESSQCYSNFNEVNPTSDSTNNTTQYLNDSQNAVAPPEIDFNFLRKIIDDISVRNPSTEVPVPDRQPAPAKKTFEYNHTQSVPTKQFEQKQNTGCNDMLETHDARFEASAYSASDKNSKPKHSDEDDDYVDTEPVNFSNEESDADNHEVSGINEEEELEPQIPMYKSKWEKIMERKASEGRGKKDINEHLLKDCFPVSSQVRSKKINTINDNIKTKPVSKKFEEGSSDPRLKHNSKSKSAKNKLFSLMPKTKNRNKNKKSISTSDIKPNSVTNSKGKNKNNTVTEPDALFAPDNIKKIDNKKSKKIGKQINKTNDKLNNIKSKDNQQKNIYGRVTNRGEFLTESTSSYLKNIKIPKKKSPDVSKKTTNSRSDEYHSVVDSPNIDVLARQSSKYKGNKASDYYKRQVRPQKLIPAAYKDNFLDQDASFQRTRDPYQNESFSRSMPAHSSLIYIHPQENVEPFKKPILETPNCATNHKGALLRTLSSTLHKDSLLETPPSYLRQTNPNQNIPSASASSQMCSNDGLMDPRLNHYSFYPQREYSVNELKGSSHPTSLDDPTNNVLRINNIIQTLWSNNPNAPENVDSAEKNSLFTLNHFGESANFNAANFNSPMGAFANAGPSPSFHVQKPVQESPSSFSHQEKHPFKVSTDSPFTHPGAVLNSVPAPATSTCLVPQHLKSLVGHRVMETSDIRLLMLEWSVDWLEQQQKFHDPPPICNSLKKVVNSYSSFETHYNTYFPLMLLDTWQRIYVTWTHLSQVKPYFCDITSYSVKTTNVTVECQTVFCTKASKGIFPDEGSILMVKYGTKSKDFTIKILGYVTQVKTRRFNQVTDSRLGSFKPPKDDNFETLQVLTLTFMGAYNSEDIDKRLPVRIHVLCNVKSTLKQNDALLHIPRSPLLNSILNPVEGGLISVALTPRNSPVDKINECVRSITKGILSPHPLPLLTIVRAVPESDRLQILPLLIEKMKTAYKTKVLLCVRTVRALGDVAANICLHKNLKMVIVNKRGDTSQQFQKYLLDELVAAERSSVDSSKESLHAKSEAIIKTKKMIFQNSDVILSLVRNCHDEFMENTFVENENVSQMCCIVDEANLCTEPETLIPILHGISKLILIGDPDYPAKVLSKKATSYDYNHSFFFRAYDLDLNTE